MIYLFLLIVISCFIWNKINNRLFNDNLSPFNLLYFSWIFPLSLRTLQMSGLENPWKIESILVIIWVTFSLIFTSLLPLYSIKKDFFIKKKMLFERTLLLFQEKVFCFVILSFFIFCFPLYIYSEFVTNPVGIPFIAAFNNKLVGSGNYHRWAKDTKWSIITPMLFILTPMLYMMYKKNKNKTIRFIFLFFALLYPIMGFFKLSRSDIFIGMLNILFIEYYYRKYFSSDTAKYKIINLKMVIGLLCIMLIVYGTLHFRLGNKASDNYYARAIAFKLNEPTKLNEILSQFYGYLALPFENFHRFYESYKGGFNPGVSALRPFLSMFAQGYIADEMIGEIGYKAISGAAGSATFLTFIYAELGTYGLLVVPFIYGLIVNILYLRFRTRPDFVNMFLYMNFVYPWLWLFFNNAFSVLTMYINAFMIIFILFINSLLLKLGRKGIPEAV